jgi:DNA-binding CsgD family transcriptional regulator
VGTDALLTCFREVPCAADEYSEIFLCRPPEDGDFSGRDKAIVEEAHAGIAPLVGGALARFTDPSPGELSPQTRLVLACLLEGDSDKQIAARLKLSRYTVNGHTKGIFRHFAVQSRAELLARWVRRGFGDRLARKSANRLTAAAVHPLNKEAPTPNK